MEMENLGKFKNFTLWNPLKKMQKYGILWVDFMHIWILNIKGLFLNCKNLLHNAGARSQGMPQKDPSQSDKFW